MTDDTTPSSDTPPDTTPAGERIAKVMARAGVASRREAERMILEGRVTVNGRTIASPALDVLDSDRITVDGRKLDEKQETRLWLYYKPIGLVTSESDEKGRQTVFDALPRDLPRVMSVGRLDLNSEGLLLLTNDGELKRRLELPSTGWLRRYRVRVNGQPNDLTFAPLRRGATIEGEEFAPMEIKLDSQQGANAWLTVGIREGRNREIRRAMAHVGLQVNRLIRISYGPFRLTGMEKNEVVEVKRRILRDQLGGLLEGENDEARAPASRDRNDRRRGGDAPRQGRDGRGSDAGGKSRPGPRPNAGFGRKPREGAEDAPRFPRGDGAAQKRRRDGPQRAGGTGPDAALRPERPGRSGFKDDGSRRPASGFGEKRGKAGAGKSKPGPVKSGSGRPGPGRSGPGRPGGGFRPGRPQGGGSGRKPRG